MASRRCPPLLSKVLGVRMGSEYTAKCECGFTAKAQYGSSRVTMSLYSVVLNRSNMWPSLTVSEHSDVDEDTESECPYFFPHFCEHCRDFVHVQINLGAERKCPKCKTTKVTPYDDPTLSECVEGPPEAADFCRNGSHFTDKEMTTNRNYRCPRCDQMTLHFKYTGVWFEDDTGA